MFVLSGRWRFLGTLGRYRRGYSGSSDISISLGMFRGFENIGTDYGMIMAVLGGDDAGGGVIWAPQVIEEAQAHGLVLGENGTLYDSKQGQRLPEGISPMAVMDIPGADGRTGDQRCGTSMGSALS